MMCILLMPCLLGMAFSGYAQRSFPDTRPLRQTMRIRDKGELKALLTKTFAMDFVIAGESVNLFKDLTFLNDDIACVRSQAVRKGQQYSDGASMEDRVINHLLVSGGSMVNGRL